MKNPISFVRAASLSEAVSYLVLLGIAMPLKYFADLPLAVRIVGSIHGALFIFLCVTLVLAVIRARWPLSRAAVVFAASFVPFIPFWLDRRMRDWMVEYSRGSQGQP